MLDTKRTKLLCAAFFISGAALALVISELCTRFAGKAASTQSPARFGTWISKSTTSTPPCGSIEAIEIPLASPDGAFPDREQRLANPTWFFEGMSEARLGRFLTSCALRPSEQRMLLDKRNWQIQADGVQISPSTDLIWSLTPESRAQIYSVLAKSHKNFPQCFPFRFPLNGFDQKFAHSDLGVADLEKMKRLTYTNSGCLCFTDLQALKSVLSPEGFKDLVENLYQMPTYILRLRVNADSDVDALVKYWGKGGREKLIAPLINSLTKVPGGTAFNVSYFLPPFARLRLYTYPYTWKEQAMYKQDCFFTSMNFFNAEPDTRFFDRTYTTKVLDTDYVPIQRDPSFGDIVALSSPNGEIIHTCVYIADGFVFTKNGADAEEPWVLMKLPDMLMLYYPVDRSGHLTFLRRKDMMAGS